MAFEISPQEPLTDLDPASGRPSGPEGSNWTELKQRIWFTLGAPITYRLGTYIPIPGIDAATLPQVFAQQHEGMLGIFDVFAGGAMSRMTIFALSVMPFILAGIIMQLLMAFPPRLNPLEEVGEARRKKINQYTCYLTVFLAAIHAYGIAVGLEHAQGPDGLSPVINPGLFFRLTTVVALTGGTVFLMWLSEQITRRGVGNGVLLIIFSGILANLPLALGEVIELSRSGQMPAIVGLVLPIMIVAVMAVVVFFERARRQVAVNYPERRVGERMVTGMTSQLPMKLNHSGVVPPIFASALLLMPLSVAEFSTGLGPAWLAWTTGIVGRDQLLHLARIIHVDGLLGLVSVD